MADLDALLARTSRTFALAIPLLPEPCRTEVGLAYLLLRIADTLEDAAVWRPERRVAALVDFTRLLRAPEPALAERLAREWTAARPSEHPGYLELVAATPEVLARLGALPEAARAIVARHTARTSEGMAGVVARAREDGGLALADVAELKRYCYLVAGIVGELLTELFVLNAPVLAGCEQVLAERAATFGEALQLVNILKDAAVDAGEGRRFLPAGAQLPELFALARADLEAAAEYVRALQHHDAPRGFVAFCALPVLLARASLDRLAKAGPGAKVSRAEVAEIVAGMNDALDRGASAIPA